MTHQNYWEHKNNRPFPLYLREKTAVSAYLYKQEKATKEAALSHFKKSILGNEPSVLPFEHVRDGLRNLGQDDSK